MPMEVLVICSLFIVTKGLKPTHISLPSSTSLRKGCLVRPRLVGLVSLSLLLEIFNDEPLDIPATAKALTCRLLVTLKNANAVL